MWLLFILCSLLTFTKYRSLSFIATLVPVELFSPFMPLSLSLFLSMKYFPNGSIYFDCPSVFPVRINLLFYMFGLFFIRMWLLLVCYNIFLTKRILSKTLIFYLRDRSLFITALFIVFLYNFFFILFRKIENYSFFNHFYIPFNL